jgi:glutathione S-transferase
VALRAARLQLDRPVEAVVSGDGNLTAPGHPQEGTVELILLSDPAVLEFLRSRMTNAFSALAAHLRENDWIACDRMTIADISVCGYLFFQDEIGIDLGHSHPAIQRWLDAIGAVDGWRHPYDLMPGHPIPGKG